jgi:phenylpyruvate tautomerase PptA (4-oxalocrotonate tautomerase family)
VGEQECVVERVREAEQPFGPEAERVERELRAASGRHEGAALDAGGDVRSDFVESSCAAHDVSIWSSASDRGRRRAVPLIRVELFDFRVDEETSTKLIAGLTDALCEATHEGLRDHTWVIVEGHDPKNWGLGGKPWPVEAMPMPNAPDRP